MSTETIINKENQTKTASCSGHVEPVVSCDLNELERTKMQLSLAEKVIEKVIDKKYRQMIASYNKFRII